MKVNRQKNNMENDEEVGGNYGTRGEGAKERLIGKGEEGASWEKKKKNKTMAKEGKRGEWERVREGKEVRRTRSEKAGCRERAERSMHEPSFGSTNHVTELMKCHDLIGAHKFSRIFFIFSALKNFFTGIALIKVSQFVVNSSEIKST